MLQEKVENAIEEVRPSLQADGGDIQFISVSEEGEVTVKLTGACHGCPMAQLTLKEGVEKYIKKIVPEVTSVISQ
ncbi:MAG: NifU family protein [Spirochaetales bacterium]|nr:MAG: NifU family protein [Spirochaetales bacterium]